MTRMDAAKVPLKSITRIDEKASDQQSDAFSIELYYFFQLNSRYSKN